MTPHPYLRAWLAGIAPPTLLLLVAVSAYTVTWHYVPIPETVERRVMFPMAVVPNLWGLWNALYLATHHRTRLSLGMHGALLPILLIPAGLLFGRLVGYQLVTPAQALLLSPVAVAVYYLVWKHVVGFLNEELGIG